MKTPYFLLPILLLPLLSYPQWVFQYPYPTGNNLRDVFFTDPENGWAVGDNGTIVHTSDGGTRWNVQFSDTIFSLSCFHFLNQSMGWVAGYISDNGLLMHTTDGGINWEIQDFADSPPFLDITFGDPDNGWIGG